MGGQVEHGSAEAFLGIEQVPENFTDGDQAHGAGSP